MTHEGAHPIMRLTPFARGLSLGLLLGFVVGHFLTAAVPPPPGSGDAELERLRHQLETARREREALEKNLSEFQRVAETMTTAFEDLEKRFRALEGRLERDDSTPSPPPSGADEPARR